MTYLQFHLYFNLPVLLALLWFTRHRQTRAFWGWVGAVCLIVFAADSPWDLWAVKQGIWGFDWERVTEIAFTWRGTVWRLPAEEYAFFVIEAVMVSLVTLFFLPKPGSRS